MKYLKDNGFEAIAMSDITYDTILFGHTFLPSVPDSCRIDAIDTSV